jgi:hypothetical protein
VYENSRVIVLMTTGSGHALTDDLWLASPDPDLGLG